MTHPITLGMIRSHEPCESGWRTLIQGLGTSNPDTILTIGDVAAINGAADAMWCLRCVDDPRVRTRAVLPAVKRASVHTADQRVHDCIATIDRWLDGKASDAELRAARAAAAAAKAAVTTAAHASPFAAAAYAAHAAAGASAAAATTYAAYAATTSATYAAAAAAAVTAVTAAEDERTQQAQDIIQMFGRLHGGQAA
jgi:hypothetical protein